MQLDIELPGAIAQQIRPHLEHISQLTRATQQNMLVAEVFEAVADALPVFYTPGDSVCIKHSSTELIVDSIASSDADQVVVHSIDRESWSVRHVDDLERFVAPPAQDLDDAIETGIGR